MIFSHDINIDIKLSEINEDLKKYEAQKDSYEKFKLYILRTLTIEPIMPILKWVFFKNNFCLEIHLEDFSVIESALYEEKSRKNFDQADLALFFPFLDFIDLNSHLPQWSSEDLSQRLENLYELFSSKKQGLLVSTNFLVPPYDVYGSFAKLTDASKLSQIKKLNLNQERIIRQNSNQSFLIDINQVIAQVGFNKSIDSRNLMMTKSPFTTSFYIYFCMEILKLGLALKGKSKKVLVLDCDNTLWGGVIGEDGLKGIKLDKDSYPGVAYYRFQQEVISLNNKGVILALSSKNNEADVFEALDHHPDCLIKRTHLSFFKINWNDKASNILEIAEFLNLGTNSFVFVDDNPIEIELVKSRIPDVTCLMVPKNIYELPGLLSKNGFFDTLAVTEEDRVKTTMYQQESERKKSAGSLQHTDRESFLKSLNLKCRIHQIQDSEIPRVSQLSQKTNQFNFNTLRMSEADILIRVNSENNLVFTCSVSDRFGDSGLTGVLLLSKNSDSILIENFFMSCRVLGRSVEHIFMNHCLLLAIDKWKMNRIVCDYNKTQKNILVENYWDELNITPKFCDEKRKTYEFSVDQVKFPQNTYIDILKS